MSKVKINVKWNKDILFEMYVYVVYVFVICFKKDICAILRQYDKKWKKSEIDLKLISHTL